MSRFKIAVERNFDSSVDPYETFEERHGLFGQVAERLAALASVNAPRPRILDVGCGSGVSTHVLSRIHSDASALVGIDISAAMVEKARDRMRSCPDVRFEKGDAEDLGAVLSDRFDAIYYNASIFLIPDYRKSLCDAAGLLVPAGCIFLSVYEGFYDGEGRDAIRRACPEISYRYGVVGKEEVRQFVGSIEGFNVASEELALHVGPAFVLDFLSIPAQSAGLFPKTPREERLPMIRELCRRMEKESGPVCMKWTLMAACRGPRS